MVAREELEEKRERKEVVAIHAVPEENQNRRYLDRTAFLCRIFSRRRHFPSQPSPLPSSSLSALYSLGDKMDLQTDRSTQEGGIAWQTGSPFLNDLRGESFPTVVSVSMETEFWRKMGRERGMKPDASELKVIRQGRQWGLHK